MQTVCQLHQDDADITYHGEDHFAEILGLGLCLALEFDLRQLADPVHQFGDISTKFDFNLFLGSRGILNDVVQDGRNNRFMIESQLRKNARRGNGMVNVGFTGQAVLSFVRLCAKQVGAIHLLHLLLVQVGVQHPAQIADQKSRFIFCAYIRSACHEALSIWCMPLIINQ